MTTAQLRKAANDAERRLDWATAADLYQQAIDAFPYSGNEAQLHINDMAKRRDAAKAMLNDAR
jgi:predicted NAD/FAD-binding protein